MTTAVRPLAPRSPVTSKRAQLARLDTAAVLWRPRAKRKNPASYVYFLEFYNAPGGASGRGRVVARGFQVQIPALGFVTYRSCAHFASKREAHAWAVAERDKVIRNALRRTAAYLKLAPTSADARAAHDRALVCRKWAWGLVG